MVLQISRCKIRHQKTELIEKIRLVKKQSRWAGIETLFEGFTERIDIIESDLVGDFGKHKITRLKKFNGTIQPSVQHILIGRNTKRIFERPRKMKRRQIGFPGE